MKDECKTLVTHISRLEGQLRSLKEKIEHDQCCENIVPLALSATKSFDSLRAKMLEHFVKNQLLKDSDTSIKSWEQFQELLKLVKA